jgi:hypothetical protein
VTSELDNLCGPGKSLRAEPPDAEYEGLLGVNERILADLIVATRAVADKLSALPAPEA